MKAITLHQPWASLLFPGSNGYRLKRFETRSWGTSYRGPLAIHAGKALTDEGRALLQCPPMLEGLARAGLPGRLEDYPRGVILGTVRLLSCHHTAELTPGGLEVLVGDWSRGRLAWETTSPNLLPRPVAARGFQGLWDWEPAA